MKNEIFETMSSLTKNYPHLTLASKILNFFLIILLGMLLFFYIEIRKRLDLISSTFNTFQQKVGENFDALNMQILQLKEQNVLLRAKAGLASSSSLNVTSVTSEDISHQYHIYITKIFLIVTIIIILSFFIFVISTSLYSWISNCLIGKFMNITNLLYMKLGGILGSMHKNDISYRTDEFGIDFIVSLSDDDKIVGILIKSEGMDSYQSLGEFLASAGKSKESLYLTLEYLIKLIAAIFRMVIKKGKDTLDSNTIESYQKLFSIMENPDSSLESIAEAILKTLPYLNL